MPEITFSTKPNSISVSSSNYLPVDLNSLSPLEFEIASHILSALSQLPNSKQLQFERRTASYLTLAFENYDFCRIKAGPKSIWISLEMFPEIKEEYANSEIFLNASKNQIHWKIILDRAEDIKKYDDLIRKVFCAATKHSLSDKQTAHLKDIQNKAPATTISQVIKANGQILILNSNEIDFVKHFSCELRSMGLEQRLHISYASKDFLQFSIDNVQIGRIKLRGRKFKMQIISKSDCNFVDIKDLSDAESRLESWIKFIRCLGLV